MGGESLSSLVSTFNEVIIVSLVATSLGSLGQLSQGFIRIEVNCSEPLVQ
jgi:hypothetical protein